jgi:DNA polymerase-3 subunit alpha
VRIARGDEYEHYPCEALRTILGPTKGVLVYQEQIMQIFNQLAGFSWAEADKMRKIIGKKLGREEFDKHREHFMAGCAESGVSAEVAADLFDKMAEFAAYSFNKSHAVAYTIISVWSMYLKVHYPVEFLAAVLSSVTDNDRMPAFAAEAKRLGIALRPPSLNASQGTYTVLDDHTIVAPFGCIKGVGERAVEEILKARQDTELGVFLNVAEFQERVNRRVVNVRVMEIMRRAGVFEELGEREADSEVRAKNFAELLPFWSALPHLSVSVDKLDTGAVAGLIFEGQTCATEAKRPYLKPKMGSAKVPIMIINNPVKGEIEHLTSDGTRFLMKTLKGLGIGAKMVYYTSPLKCAFPKGAVPPTLCEAKCGALLKREIEAVKPKLVVCFGAGPAMTMLGADGGMAKNHGRVVYNRELDTYVLFSYSPQYAFYQEGKLGEFQAAMVKIREIFYDL